MAWPLIHFYSYSYSDQTWHVENLKQWMDKTFINGIEHLAQVQRTRWDFRPASQKISNMFDFQLKVAWGQKLSEIYAHTASACSGDSSRVLQAYKTSNQKTYASQLFTPWNLSCLLKQYNSVCRTQPCKNKIWSINTTV